MPKVEIYTSPLCPFCYRAKRLLDSKGVEYEEIDVSFHRKRRQEMIERAGGDHKVPQVFVDGHHVGGSDKLAMLEDSGELDRILESAAA